VGGIAAGRRGFTLIELMIVVSIIGILVSFAVPNYQWSLVRAREAVLRENLYNFRSTIDQFYADQGKYPDSLQELVEKGYLRGIPTDPFTGKNDTWVTVPPPAEAAPATGPANLGSTPISGGTSGSSASSGPGNVYDVLSGSEKVSPSNNLPYNDPSW
jgi:general secretion pathway protein G